MTMLQDLYIRSKKLLPNSLFFVEHSLVKKLKLIQSWHVVGLMFLVVIFDLSRFRMIRNIIVQTSDLKGNKIEFRF